MGDEIEYAQEELPAQGGKEGGQNQRHCAALLDLLGKLLKAHGSRQREHRTSQQKMAVSAAHDRLAYVLCQLKNAIILFPAAHTVILQGMNHPSIAAQQRLGGDLAANILAPGNQRMIENHQRTAGAQHFKQIVQAAFPGRQLQAGMELLNPGGGHSSHTDVK